MGRWRLVADGEVEVVHGVIVDGAPQASVAVPWKSQVDVDSVITMPGVVQEMIRGSLSHNTWVAYRKQWAYFLRWCGRTGRTPLPCSLPTLLSYLAYLATVEVGPGRFGLSVDFIRQALAAMRIFHSAGDPPPDWPGGHQTVAKFVKGYRNKRAQNPDYAPKRATGARKVVLAAMLDALPMHEPRGVRDKSLLLTTYYLAGRRSETLGLTDKSWRMTQDGLELFIATSKTDQAGEGRWVPIPANPVSPQYCPVQAWQGWLEALSDQGIREGAIFRPINKAGTIREVGAAMSGTGFYNAMGRAVDEAYTAAKWAKDSKRKLLLDPNRHNWSPHSLRRGFATDARASGWDLLDIARHGRWSAQSSSLHLYLEENDRWLRHATNAVLLGS